MALMISQMNIQNAGDSKLGDSSEANVQQGNWHRNFGVIQLPYNIPTVIQWMFLYIK